MENTYSYNREGCVVGMKCPETPYRNDAAKYRALSVKCATDIITRQKLSDTQVRDWYENCFLKVVENVCQAGHNKFFTIDCPVLDNKTKIQKDQLLDYIRRRGFSFDSILSDSYKIYW